ncbi:hypothetical protein RND71_017625 [Anisodus tanguticus]|uniref:Uncharacterized protein n=1 Tax=Anisodus tanguticus TaxID=243964 RepID=A0AAE1S0X6_9SOLA|nr:hypothetical protein RND71_017625 [Anisodus tanguticus]
MDKIGTSDQLIHAFLSSNAQVVAADAKLVEDTIRCGGLAPTKTSCIKGILSSLFQKKRNLCLEYFREQSIEEIKRELSCFRGIVPKMELQLLPSFSDVHALYTLHRLSALITML